MRAAPLVDAALAHGRVGRLCVQFLYLAASLALVGWFASWSGPWHLAGRLDWPSARALCAVGALLLPVLAWRTGAWQARRWFAPGPRRLVWSGHAWACRDGDVDSPVTTLAMVSVQLDLGTWILLRLTTAEPSPQVQWALVYRRSAGPAWHGLLVALRHHAGGTPAYSQSVPARFGS